MSSAVSGVLSRQVLPACDSLCFFCPAIRTRSRHPVKRYKHLIADIFPKNPEEEPNDRKIGKLCEYAARNPLRIPKIANSLERKCYKELRNENFWSVKIIMCIYRKLIVSCNAQLSLFASSVLTIMQTLLDQTNKDEILTIGCESLFDFAHNQNDGSYISNLDGFVPKLCQLAQEEGDDERAETIRAAGLKALSALVWLMGENSHISDEFDSIVSVVLENYEGIIKDSTEPSENSWVQEVQKTEGNLSASSDVSTNVLSWKVIVNEKGQPNTTQEQAKDPRYWSRVCLHNMAKLGKEATTMRRVLESLFRYFDNGNLWNAKDGIAFPVLREMQLLMDESGENAHFLLSILVKHLDHKNVVKQPEMQLDIFEVVMGLSRLTKVQSSLAVVSAVSDVMRHLRRCMQSSLDGSDVEDGSNRKFLEVVDECLTELSSKVGDAGLILDVMASMLENISTVFVVARTTVSAVYRTGQIIASLPNLSYRKRAFPESLFHQLLPAMLHSDHETRIGAHQIFSIVLVPSSVSPQLYPAMPDPNKKMDFTRTLSRTVSVFSSSAALFKKLTKKNSSFKDNLCEANQTNVMNTNGVMNKVMETYSRVYSMKSLPEIDSEPVAKDPVPLRLSSHQISVLLSSLWAQSISPENQPENYVAMAHTYSLVLLFSRAKNSYREALVRCFQLAFSLRSVSLASGGKLPPSRRRSLFVMSTCMIIFSSKAYDILPLIPHAKAILSDNVVDPYLCLVEDSKLHLNEHEGHQTRYGSEEDDTSAKRCLSDIKINEDQTIESFAYVIIKFLDNLSESTTMEQLVKEFVPDELCSTSEPRNEKSLTKAASLFLADDEPILDSLDCSKHGLESSDENFNLLSVDQLLQSVLDTAPHVGRMSVSTAADVSYKETADQCERLKGKQKQPFNLLDLPSQKSERGLNCKTTPEGENAFGVPAAACSVVAQQNTNSFKLPSSNPYDKFLNTAGC